jgi:hypothetical protein
MTFSIPAGFRPAENRAVLVVAAVFVVVLTLGNGKEIPVSAWRHPTGPGPHQAHTREGPAHLDR